MQQNNLKKIISTCMVATCTILYCATSSSAIPLQSKVFMLAKNDATKMVVPSTGPGEHQVRYQKIDARVGAPAQDKIANERYMFLGPNGSPTPDCPRDPAASCPDGNGMLNGRYINEITAQEMCPDICHTTRRGDLFGSTPAACPPGYSVMGFFNMQDEWVRDPNPTGPVTISPAPTNDIATFQDYYYNPESYLCYADFVEYGDEICLPLKGNSPDEIADPALRADVYAASYGTPAGINDGKLPYAFLNPIDSKSYSKYQEQDAGVAVLFGGIRGKNKIPATWAPYSNQSNVPFVKRGIYEQSGDDIKKCVGGACSGMPELVTYADSACTVRAKAKAYCEQSEDLSGDYYVQGPMPTSPRCKNIYFKLKIPVYALYCDSKRQKILNTTGNKIPTSMLCGRVKVNWE